MSTQTPWGVSERATEIAPGITFHSTASHGGFHLSEERRAAMPAEYRNSTWVPGGTWYEEDCDAYKVVATFPEHFSAKQVESARRMLGLWLSPPLKAALQEEIDAAFAAA